MNLDTPFLLYGEPKPLPPASGGAGVQRGLSPRGAATAIASSSSGAVAASSSSSIPATKLSAAKGTARQLYYSLHASQPLPGSSSLAQPTPPFVAAEPHLAARRRASAGSSHGSPPSPTTNAAAARKAKSEKERTAHTKTPTIPMSSSSPTAPRANGISGGGGGRRRPGALGRPAAAVDAASQSASCAAHDDFTAAPPVASSSSSSTVETLLPALMQDVHGASATLLRSMFPPKVTADPVGGEGAVVQHVSLQPASRESVVALHDALQARLEVRRAKESGVCAIRREIYDDVFAELLRQITIEDAARGVLLRRIRDDLQHSLRLHESLATSAKLFASRQQLASNDGKDELRERIAQLQDDVTAIASRHHTLKQTLEEQAQRIEEERQQRLKAQQAECAFLRRANQQLSLRLKAETERASTAGAAVGATGSSSPAAVPGAGASSVSVGL